MAALGAAAPHGMVRAWEERARLSAPLMEIHFGGQDIPVRVQTCPERFRASLGHNDFGSVHCTHGTKSAALNPKSAASCRQNEWVISLTATLNVAVAHIHSQK